MNKFARSLILALVGLSSVTYAATPTTKTVASFNAVNQTGPIALTTLFTPTINANYRISLYLVGNASPFPNVGYTWTDELGNNRNQGALFASGGAIGQYQPYFVHAIAGQPIEFNVPTTITSGSFDIFIDVEQVGAAIP